MPSADDPVLCPHCLQTSRFRELRSTFYSKQTCYCACGGVATTEEHHGLWQSEEAFTQEDVSGIAAWLDSVAQAAGLVVQPVRDLESIGQFLWIVQGLPSPWRCEASYERDNPGVVLVRLCVDVSLPEALPDSETLRAACASCGVQPGGMKGSKSWWGAGQFLGTAFLPPRIFRPVVDRLNGVVQQVAAQFPPR